MSDLPRFGQYSQTPRKEACPRHPDQQAIAFCKRCNRPTCVDCTVPTEVGSSCVDCTKNRFGGKSRGWASGRLTSSKDQPVVTYGIILACVAVYLIGMAWPLIKGYLGFQPILAMGQPWRFLTVSLVHGGFFHLLFNMMMLYFIGSAGEVRTGHLRFTSLFLLSTMGGSLAVLAWGLAEPTSLYTWTVGASGAIYGLLGGVLVAQLMAKMDVRAILVLLAINLGFSFVNAATVSWQGHVGGLIVGSLAAWMYLSLSKPRPGVTERRQNLWEALGTIGVTAVLVGAAWGIYQLVIPTVPLL